MERHQLTRGEAVFDRYLFSLPRLELVEALLGAPARLMSRRQFGPGDPFVDGPES